MELCAKYLKKKLFILFHLHTLLSQAELQSFCRDVRYRKLCVLFVETADISLPYPARKVIVDTDMCQI